MRRVASSTYRVIYHDVDLIGSVVTCTFTKSQALSQTVDHRLAMARLNCWSALDWLHIWLSLDYIYISLLFSLIRKTRKQTPGIS